VASALNSVDYPLIHVNDAFPQNIVHTKFNKTPDEDLARWCAQTQHVLVSTDEDFQGKWVRSGLLRDEGVEVIWFTGDLVGIREQHHRITRHFPSWELELGRQPYGHRVWIQATALAPKVKPGTGTRRAARSRPKASSTVHQRRV
jgi:hypothetical protein